MSSMRAVAYTPCGDPPAFDMTCIVLMIETRGPNAPSLASLDGAVGSLAKPTRLIAHVSISGQMLYFSYRDSLLPLLSCYRAASKRVSVSGYDIRMSGLTSSSKLDATLTVDIKKPSPSYISREAMTPLHRVTDSIEEPQAIVSWCRNRAEAS
jgi:hypothetical protein